MTITLAQLRNQGFFENKNILPDGEYMSSMWSANLSGPLTIDETILAQRTFRESRTELSIMERLGFASQLACYIIRRQDPAEAFQVYNSMSDKEVSDYIKDYIGYLIKYKPRLERVVGRTIGIRNMPISISGIGPKGWGCVGATAQHLAIQTLRARRAKPEAAQDAKAEVSDEWLAQAVVGRGIIAMTHDVFAPNAEDEAFRIGNYYDNYNRFGIPAGIILGKKPDTGVIDTLARLWKFKDIYADLNMLVRESVELRQMLSIFTEYMGVPTDEEIDARPEGRNIIITLKVLIASDKDPSLRRDWEWQLLRQREGLRDSILLGNAMYWWQRGKEARTDFALSDFRETMKHAAANRQDVAEILKAINGQDYRPDFKNNPSDMGWLGAYALLRMFDGPEASKYRKDSILFMLDTSRSFKIDETISFTPRELLDKYLLAIGALKEGQKLEADILSDPRIWGKLMFFTSSTLEKADDRQGAERDFIEMIIEYSTIPVIVDAGIGKPSHASEAMEMGASAVLINTAIATAEEPALISKAFALAVQAGRYSYLAKARASQDRASASSPLTGFLREKG